MAKWWMIRAGDDNELIPDWTSKGIASIGWPEVENPTSFADKQSLIAKCDTVYADEKPGTRKTWANQVWRFHKEVTAGDKIITYEQSKREYLIGSVTQGPKYQPGVSNDYPNIIGVDWEAKRISRDLLSQGAKNSLGAISTIFRVDSWENEFLTLLAGQQSVAANTDDDQQQTYDDFIQNAHTWVEDYIDKLDPWQMQDLVGGVLRAMGYQARVSPKGADGGIDIIAHRDAFGFEKPIIKVQVKHRKEQSSSPEIQQLLGANPIGESCLFVSTGGFSSAAVKTAKNNGVKLIDLSDLVDLIFEWYEQIPDDIKTLIPMKKVYIPVKND